MFEREQAEPHIFHPDDLEVVETSQYGRLYAAREDTLHDPEVIPQTVQTDKVYVVMPSGECGGVRMTNEGIRVLNLRFRGRVRGNHAPTHGADANAEFEQMGARFDVPAQELQSGEPYVISAHGAAPKVYEEAREQGLDLYDLTCPLVRRTHEAVEAAGEQNAAVFFISFGSPEHAEVVGTSGHAARHEVPLSRISNIADIETVLSDQNHPIYERRKASIIGQTTNNSDEAEALAAEVQRRVSEAIPDCEYIPYDPKFVCRTVRDRQTNVRGIVAERDLDSLVVVGSVNSKNTHALAEVALEEAEKQQWPLDVYLVNSWQQLPDLRGKVAVASGASTLQQNVDGVVARLNPREGHELFGDESDEHRRYKPIDLHTRELFEEQS